MRRSLLSLLVIGLVSITSIQLSRAFFSDVETSSENVLAAGILDLKVNNADNPPTIVNVTDLKPGDISDVAKTLRVVDNDAYLWMHIKEVVTGQGEQTDPETSEEGGTAKHDINNYLTYSLEINQSSVTNTPIAFNDAVSCWIPLGKVTGDELVEMQQSFIFDAGVTNWAQGDTLTFTEEFYAEQVRNNPTPTGPTSTTGRVWNEVTHSCVSTVDDGSWSLVFTCTAGCSGSYPHTMAISSLTPGNISGTGAYDPNTNYSWNMTGTIVGSSINMTIDYTNLNPTYEANLSGTINSSTNMTGTATSNTGQSFTWEANKN